MEGADLSDEALIAAMRAHPELRKRVTSILVAVEGDEGELSRLRSRRARPGRAERLMETQKDALKGGRLTSSCRRSPDMASPPRSMTSTRPCEHAIATSAPTPTN